MSLKEKTRQFTIGITEEKEVTIYPLSLGDQLDLLETIKAIVTKLTQFDSSSYSVESVVSDLLEVAAGDLVKFLEKVIREDFSIYEISNDQLYELIMLVYEMNFQRFSKNLKSLFKMKDNLEGQIPTES